MRDSKESRQHTPTTSNRYRNTRRQDYLQRNLEPEPEWQLHQRWRQHGIQAEFISQPPVYTYPNRITPLDNIIQEGITHMLKNGWIREIHDWHINPGHYSKLKCVKKASGKFRYTLACVEINKYTAKRHFRTDDLRTLKDILEPGMHMGLLDIQDAFYSKAMRLHHQHTRYFRFAIKTQVGIRAFEYTVTPQGWSSSPRAMHIMLREVK